MKAVYFGSSSKVIEVLINHFEIVHVIFEMQTINLKLINICEWHSIPYTAVKKRQEISKLQLPFAHLGISFGIGIIFKSKEIKLFKHGIWNIHPGELPKYRGRHPISWAMLKNEKKIGVTIHIIDEKIDRGIKLSSGYVPRKINDNENDILNKIHILLDNSLLEKAIRNFITKEYKPIGRGNYYKSLTDGFDEIIPSKVSSTFLFNLLKSQSSHGGVRVLGENYSSGFYYHNDFKQFFKGAFIVECNDGKKLGLFKKHKKI